MDDFDETDFRIQPGHIYEHLNRAWNGRAISQQAYDKDWDQLGQFPEDMTRL